MSNHATRLRCLACAALMFALVVGGCAERPQPPARPNLPSPTARHVDFANLTARTSAVDAAPAVTAEELLARIVALRQGESAPARVQRLVQRFPDAALEVLRNTSSAQASHADRLSVAVAYDRAFIAIGSTGWTKTLVDAVSRAEEYESVHQARLLALQFIAMGRPERVFTQLKFPAQSTFPLAQAELLRVRGIAALLCDRAPDALRDWRSAEDLARGDRSVYSEICLLQAEAFRSRGATADSITRWSMAAAAAAGVHDPGLWQRILDARDESAPWPAEVEAAFESPLHMPPAAPHSGDPAWITHVEGRIWRQIGEWRFARGEAASALLAFKQAESFFMLPVDRAEARIAEARALLTINQTGAAVSILASLANDSNVQVSHHALAVLGNARIALDDIPGALKLLQMAVANDDTFPLPLRAPARADLGLVCLMSSREQDGLTWLHRAQSDFEAERDNAGLVQCLQNEAAYLDQAGKTEQAKIIRNRAVSISSAY